MIPLHGIGGRQDLPLPFSLVVAGAAAALIATFLILAATSTARAADGGRDNRPLPSSVTRLVDSPAMRWIVRTIGLAVAAFMAAALLFGPDLLTNPIFGFLYVWVWVGLVPVSLLVGPIWATLNPFRTLHLIGCRLLRTDPTRGLFTLSRRVGIWPAVGGLASFVWLELIAPDRATIPTVLFWVALYSVTMLFGTVLFGQRWIGAADPFEVYAATVAKLSPWARGVTGPIVARPPLANLRTLDPKAGTVTFIAVLLASTGYDGFSNSAVWYQWAAQTPIPGRPLGTLALAGFIVVVLGSYTAAVVLAGRVAGRHHRKLPGLFAHTLVPIALGYVAAHYLTLLILEGQRVFINISDPLGRGWNLFNTAERGVDMSIVNYPSLIGSLQVGAVVAGHILGAITAHRQAVNLFPRRAAIIGQVPLLTVMVGYTVAGLLLLFAE